jgi:hypothetical protein
MFADLIPLSIHGLNPKMPKIPQQLRSRYEVDVPHSNTTIVWTPIFEWYAIRHGSKNQTKHTYMFKRDWTTRSEYANHPRFNDEND